MIISFEYERSGDNSLLRPPLYGFLDWLARMLSEWFLWLQFAMCEGKIFSVCINVLLLVLGFAVVLQGSIILTDKAFFNATYLMGEGVDLSRVTSLAVMLGILLFATGVFGMMSNLFPHPVWFVNYLVFALFLIVAFFIFTCFVIRALVLNQLPRHIHAGFRFLIEEQERNTKAAVIMNNIQRELKCCGGKGPEDYRGFTPAACRSGSLVFVEGCIFVVETSLNVHSYVFLAEACLALLMLSALVAVGLATLRQLQ